MGPTDITIRAFQPADLDALMALFARAVRETASREYGPAQIEAWAPAAPDRTAWAARLGGRPTLVARRDGAIAGFSDLEPDGHIDMMFVDPAHQKQGVAFALLEQIVVMARAKDLSRLHTEASLTARPFFERNGFTVLAEQDVELRGQTFRNFRMERGF